MIKKIRFIFAGIGTYKNWPSWLAYKLSRSRGEHEEIMVLRSGVKFATRFDRNEPGTIDDIFVRGEYDAYKTAVPENGIVIDIGANIGAFSVAAAIGVPTAKVWSYEPAPDTFGMLKKNIEINHLGNRVKIFNMAVAGEKGERVLSEDPSNSGLASLGFGRDGEGIRVGLVSHTVKTTTLADIFNENNISHCDFLKMDCEGAEFGIFEGASDSLFAKIGVIGMEYHGDPAPLVAKLVRAGFSVEGVVPGSKLGIITARRNNA